MRVSSLRDSDFGQARKRNCNGIKFGIGRVQTGPTCQRATRWNSSPKKCPILSLSGFRKGAQKLVWVIVECTEVNYFQALTMIILSLPRPGIEPRILIFVFVLHFAVSTTTRQVLHPIWTQLLIAAPPGDPNSASFSFRTYRAWVPLEKTFAPRSNSWKILHRPVILKM